jgi:hypothetical protein
MIIILLKFPLGIGFMEIVFFAAYFNTIYNFNIEKIVVLSSLFGRW